MQKRRHSLLEAIISTSIGFVVSYITNLLVLPLFGFQVTFMQSLWITIIFTIASIARGYYVRRLFNWLHAREIL